eukprot:340539-Rhodomonas_salina.1
MYSPSRYGAMHLYASHTKHGTDIPHVIVYGGTRQRVQSLQFEALSMAEGMLRSEVAPTHALHILQY